MTQCVYMIGSPGKLILIVMNTIALIIGIAASLK